MANWEMQVDCDTTARTWRMCGEVMATLDRDKASPLPYLALATILEGDTISQGCEEAFILGYHAAFRPRK